ncbi:MAG TPA: flagellar biosynthetic protein FliR [Clostridia bacterium]|nr:flagellar biosynthetic protein FliR [Clostridia bacterium]
MILLDTMIILILVFVRMTALLILTPLFNNTSVPSMVKIGFIFFLSYIIMPVVAVRTDLVVLSFLDLGKYIVIEFVNGIAFGFVVSLTLSFVYISGLLVDRNIGFAMVSVINPEYDSQMPISANMFFLFLSLLFFVTNAHHLLIEAVVESYKVVPLGNILINNRVIYFYTEVISDAFIVGIQIAAPFILTILIANVILGLLSKAMPGMNVFLVGLPLKVFVGLVTFLIVMAYYFDAFNLQLRKMVDFIYQLMGA